MGLNGTAFPVHILAVVNCPAAGGLHYVYEWVQVSPSMAERHSGYVQRLPNHNWCSKHPMPNMLCDSTVVALSGGTGSAVVAYLVASVFEDSTILCIGKSAALQPEKLERARFVADLLGVAHSFSVAHSLYCCLLRRSFVLACRQRNLLGHCSEMWTGAGIIRGICGKAVHTVRSCIHDVSLCANHLCWLLWSCHCKLYGHS